MKSPSTSASSATASPAKRCDIYAVTAVAKAYTGVSSLSSSGSWSEDRLVYASMTRRGKQIQIRARSDSYRIMIGVMGGHRIGSRFACLSLISSLGGDDRYPEAPAGTTWRDYKVHSIHSRANAFDLSGYAMRAEWLAPELSAYISLLLGQRFGDGLRSNVGCVRVLLEGVVYKEFQIG